MEAAGVKEYQTDHSTPDINPVCSRMLNCRLTGNITPISWFRNILTKSGKPDVVAIILLSDIVYWYTPMMTRDEHSGDVIGIQQKFQADKLQKTYQEYSDIFGFSKNQIKNAIDNLCDQKLITREFRHIKTGSGLAITNVMYIEPIFENIVKISNKIRTPQKVGGYPPKKWRDIPSKNGGTSPQKMGGRIQRLLQRVLQRIQQPPQQPAKRRRSLLKIIFQRQFIPASRSLTRIIAMSSQAWKTIF